MAQTFDPNIVLGGGGQEDFCEFKFSMVNISSRTRGTLS